MLQCPLCEKSSNDPWKLNKHTLSHTKEKPHKCRTCSSAFGDKSNLIKHIQHVHNGIKKNRTIKNPLNCPKCTYQCSGRDTLERHIRKHSVDFTCSVPGCGFKIKYYKSYLRKHFEQAHSDERPYESSIAGCNYKAKSLYLLKVHLRIHSNERPFSCSSSGCNYTAKTKQALRSHTHAMHSDGILLKFTTCEYQTKFKSKLRQHEENKHKNIKRFQCTAPNCSFATNSKTTFGTHLDAEHRGKSVICTVSMQLQMWKLGFAQETHASNFKSCNLSTRKSHALQSHVSCRHKDSQFVIPVPPRQYHLPNVDPADPVDYFICPVPNYNYQTEFQHRLDRHLVAHDEEKRKFVCKICSLRFTDPWGLNLHVRRHIREKPYRCSHCYYTFVTSGRLRSHAGNVHGIFVPTREKPLMGVKKCQISKISCTSHNEFVLHSMCHLQAVVVLQRLNIKCF